MQYLLEFALFVQSTWVCSWAIEGLVGDDGWPFPRPCFTYAFPICQFVFRLKLEPKYFKRLTYTPRKRMTNDAVVCARHHTVTYVGRSSPLSFLGPKQ